MKRAGLAATIKARWICEQAHQQSKEKLGLDHFEGRSWQGLHRHALRGSNADYACALFDRTITDLPIRARRLFRAHAKTAQATALPEMWDVHDCDIETLRQTDDRMSALRTF
jgi:SRSO17 transposase